MTNPAPTLPVRVGDSAPDFTLRDQHGREVSLSSFRGRPIVLYFYPRNGTPACTTEACTFRDQMAEFADLDARIIGVSGDTVESHADFARRHNLSFTLLSDADGAVRARYAVPRTFGLFPGRMSFVIDAAGIVRHAFNSQFQAKRHIEEARAALERLKKSIPRPD